VPGHLQPVAGGRRSEIGGVFRELLRCTSDHKLPVYSAALAFQTLTSLVPITLLGLAILGAAGLEDVWRDTLAPSVEEKVTRPVFEGIDYSVERVFRQGSAGLIVLAFALVLWYVSFAVRLLMDALNTIHDVRERRSRVRQVVTALGLAFATACLFVAATLVVTAGPRIADGGVLDWTLTILRWPAAALLLAAVVALLIRYAPAERPQVRWASAGSLLVIGVWIAASLLFRGYVSTLANFKTAVGSLTVFLVLTAYVFVSSAIFLVGAQLDELLRAKSGEKGR
jgi:membrane protein